MIIHYSYVNCAKAVIRDSFAVIKSLPTCFMSRLSVLVAFRTCSCADGSCGWIDAIAHLVANSDCAIIHAYVVLRPRLAYIRAYVRTCTVVRGAHVGRHAQSHLV